MNHLKRTYRTIEVSMWQDPEFRALSPDAKYLFQYLITCPNSHLCGLFYCPLPLIAHETGLVPDAISDALVELAGLNWVKTDPDCGVVWVMKMLSHQAQYSPSIAKHISSHIARIQSEHLKEEFLSKYENWHLYDAPACTLATDAPTEGASPPPSRGATGGGVDTPPNTPCEGAGEDPPDGVSEGSPYVRDQRTENRYKRGDITKSEVVNSTGVVDNSDFPLSFKSKESGTENPLSAPADRDWTATRAQINLLIDMSLARGVQLEAVLEDLGITAGVKKSDVSRIMDALKATPKVASVEPPARRLDPVFDAEGFVVGEQVI